MWRAGRCFEKDWSKSHRSEWLSEYPRRQSGDALSFNLLPTRPPSPNTGDGLKIQPAQAGLLPITILPILTTMYLEPFTSLSWAYQLHYYLCIGTYRHRPTLAASGSRMSDLIAEICARHDYHPLKLKSYPDHVRLLVSLRPNQTISKALQTIESNARPASIVSPLMWSLLYGQRATSREALAG